MALAHGMVSNIGVPATLEELFWTYHKRVLRAAYRITGNMADAEDVAQSVFLRLASSDAGQIGTAESYLYRSAINGALDVIRNRKGDRAVALEEVGELPTSAPSASPERQHSSAQLRGWLRLALSELSPKAAELFVLRYIEELDNREISRITGTSRAVIAVMLHQAKARLRKKFEQQMRGIR